MSVSSSASRREISPLWHPLAPGRRPAGPSLRHFSRVAASVEDVKRSRRQTDPPRFPLGADPTRRRLTAREREIALLVADGLKDAAIATRLGLSRSTVGTYIWRIQHRLGVNGRGELAAWVAARRDPDHPEAGLRRGPDDRLT